MLRAASVLCGALVLAGCLAAPAAPPPVPGHDARAVPAPFAIQAGGCEEGGSYVTWNAYPGDPNFPAPFEPVDVSADVGDPPLTSVGLVGQQLQAADAAPGDNVTGAYHPVVRCATGSMGGEPRSELWLAIVAARIAPPPFDAHPAARTYLALLGAADPDVVAGLRGAGFDVEHITDVALGLDAGALHQTVKFEHHGDIVADVPLAPATPKASETIRLWTLARVDDLHVRPLALDLVDTGGERLVASAPGFFEHTASGTAPPAPGMPLHTFTSWALAYRGVERTIQAGPAPDVVLDLAPRH